MKYNVPLHSWKHSALTASSLWATVGAKYMSTCQTETSISGAAMLVCSNRREREREERGIPRRLVGKQEPLTQPFHQKDSPPPTPRNLGEFLSSCGAHVEKKKKNATLECIRGERRKRGRWRASSSLPTGTIQSQTLTSPAAQLNSHKKKSHRGQKPWT